MMNARMTRIELGATLSYRISTRGVNGGVESGNELELCSKFTQGKPSISRSITTSAVVSAIGVSRERMIHSPRECNHKCTVDRSPALTVSLKKDGTNQLIKGFICTSCTLAQFDDGQLH